MRIAWFLGFGWPSVITVVACGAGINLFDGPVVKVLYIPFLLVAFYMTVRFRLFTRQPWRRAHARAMLAYGKLAEQEYEASKREGRKYEIAVPCRKLAETLFGPESDGVSALLLDDHRKNYYKGLATEFPQVFLEGISEKRQAKVLEGVERDIDGSKLGPDILVARLIEKKVSRREAASYLRALMAGEVR